MSSANIHQKLKRILVISVNIETSDGTVVLQWVIFCWWKCAHEKDNLEYSWTIQMITEKQEDIFSILSLVGFVTGECTRNIIIRDEGKWGQKTLKFWSLFNTRS